MRISDWRSDVCSSDLDAIGFGEIDRVHLAAVVEIRRAARARDRYRTAGPGRLRRLEKGKALVDRLAERTGHRRTQAETAAIALDEGMVGVGIQRGEISRCRKQVAGVLSADAEQLGIATCRESVCQYV